MKLNKIVKMPMHIQWYVTDKCQNNCLHCYLSESPSVPRGSKKSLDLKQKIDIIRLFDEFGDKYGFDFRNYMILGGDPLLDEDIFPFLEHLRALGKNIIMIGNPETLTDENCSKLSKLKINGFALSLDGLEKTHDFIRGKGSFQRTIEGHRKLYEYNIPSMTSFTLSLMNIDEFFDLIDYVFYNSKSRGFAFDFCNPVGNAKDIPLITPKQALYICNTYLKHGALRKNERPEFIYQKRSRLFGLLDMYQKNRAYIDRGKTEFYSGCPIGMRLCIYSDGSIPICGRFPHILGKLPEESIEDILLKNEILKMYRRPQFFEDCGKCIAWNWCRGCPAYANYGGGNSFKKPNICFAHLLDMNTHQEHEPIPMDTTLQEEVNLIKNSIYYKFYPNDSDANFRKLATKITNKLSNPVEAQRFVDNPRKWFQHKAPSLKDNEQDCIIYQFNRNKRYL